jgi:hypothetical protein
VSRATKRAAIALAIVAALVLGWILFGSTTTRTTDGEYRCRRLFGRVTRITVTPLSPEGSPDLGRREVLLVPWSDSVFSCTTAVEIASGVSWQEEEDG